MIGTTRRDAQDPIKLWVRNAAMIAAISVLTACGGAQDGGNSGTGSGSGTSADAGSDICAAAQKEPIDPKAQLLVVVVDHTASARTDLADPPSLSDAIAKIQAEGVKDEKGSQIQTLGVTASGEFPTISKPLSLDLKPGNTSPNAENLRAKIVRDCVPGILKVGGPQPSGGNTDLLGALLAAKQQSPQEIAVMSSGLNSTPQANLTVPPNDPAQVADSVKQAIPDFAAWSIPVTWFYLGEPNPPLSAPDRDRVIAFWKALLGENLTVNTRE